MFNGSSTKSVISIPFTASPGFDDVAFVIKTDAVDRSNNALKYGIWVYFFLLIFEGALRKWVLPGLATPLLIVRDPIALWLLIKAWQRGLMPTSPYLISIYVVGIIAILATLMVGHGNLIVTIYGARILLLHFPLMFAIGQIFTKEDAIQLGKATVWMTMPMALLIALQFYSPQSAWINKGIGDSGMTGGFDGAMGYFRPPATFSFTNGTALFFGFAGIFIFYFWFNLDKINKIILIIATIGLIIAVPLSISRSLSALLGLTFLFTLISTLRKPKYLVKIIIGAAVLVAVALALNKTSFFQTATDVFSARINNANDAEGGVQSTFVDRFLGGMTGAIESAESQPFFGYGLGMGTGVGSMLLAGDSSVYLISEGEWGRLIGESGLLLGLIVILIRLSLTVEMTINSFVLMRNGEMLPWLLLSIGFLAIMQGQWAQPTTLGFHVIIGGLILASLKESKPLFWLIKK